VGAAYAAWGNTIFAQATVNTGNTSAQFVNGPFTVNGNNDVVATATADGATLLVTVNDAYPGAVVTNLPFQVNNNGTVPMTVSSVVLDSNPNGELATFTGVAPTDTSIAVGANSGTYGYISFSMNSNPSVIGAGGQYTFTVDINYTVAPGN
jgi:hypothetical protein